MSILAASFIESLRKCGAVMGRHAAEPSEPSQRRLDRAADALDQTVRAPRLLTGGGRG